MYIQPLTTNIGAEISGVELASPDAAGLAELLRPALLRHGVLVFREQHLLTRDNQLALAKSLGEPESIRVGEEQPEVIRIIHGPDAPPTENIWHSDLSFRSNPPLGAILRAIEIPAVGGDTVFADMRHAWQRLPNSLQKYVRSLKAQHDIAKWAPAAQSEFMHEQFPPILHPIAVVHPETKQTILYVNQGYTTSVPGLSEADSSYLLNRLFQEVSSPEVQCRIRWNAGTVVLWDNRSVQHYAVGDYMPAIRIMDRVSISGGKLT
jgi:taurine dioxygenase